MERVLLAIVHWQDAPEQRVIWFVWQRTWQHCISWRTHTAQRLDSGLPSHAPVTGHSIKEAQQAPTSPWSLHHACCQHKAEHPHVYARSCQDGCKFGYSTSQRGDSHPKCIRTISRLGASGSTDTQADAAIHGTVSRGAWTFPLISIHIQASHRPMRRPLPLPQYQHSEMARLTGLGKPAVAGEERFRSFTELKWDEFEADGLRGPGSSFEKITV